ncbi:hypothetical protein [Spirosoma sp. KUDC1026]|uniref:hypothetical protein n=1 Tax=Spirosoma sp. KUDC1026 TaxID=2745947 RepID=UPI00159BE468|nr:hypothetical protein [Spirosoma sp. KUDC1026]QKZ11324.1 hypothetical protein HU175_01195 [Spirosoma sp. KUDC1026]
MDQTFQDDLYSWLGDVNRGELDMDEAIALIQARVQGATREIVDSVTSDALERSNREGMRMSLQQARLDFDLDQREPLTPAEEATELLGEEPELGGISD